MFDIENFPTRQMSKDMLGMVSPIYDEAYVGKWIFQILGKAMELASDTIRGIEQEGFPNTATAKTLAMWEELYGITPNESLPEEQRRIAIIVKRNYRRPMNPARIAALATDVTGRQAFVREKTALYTYEICILPGESTASPGAVRSAVDHIRQPKAVVIVFETPTAVKIRAEPGRLKYPYAMAGTRKAGPAANRPVLPQ